MILSSAWRTALGNLRLKKLLADKPKYDALRALSAPTSPLRQILESIRDETALTKERPKPANAPAPTDVLARPAPALFNTQDGSPGAGIEAQFKPFHSVLEGDSTRRPIDSVIANLNDIAQNLTLIVENPQMTAQATDFAADAGRRAAQQCVAHAATVLRYAARRSGRVRRQHSGLDSRTIAAIVA